MLWAPQEGPQAAAAICPADITFYGGTRGGGKSDGLLGRQLRGAEKYASDWNGLIVRRKFKEFAEMRRRLRGMLARGLPAELIGGDQQTNYLRFDNGALVTLTAVHRAEMLAAFQGQQYTEISIDEAPDFPFLATMIDQLRGCLRSPAGVPCRMFLTGNPGGPATSIVKAMFMDERNEGEPYIDDDTGEITIFIKSTLYDNKILVENDPKYVKRLESIKNKELRKAWLEGDWDSFVGQMFTFIRRYHVIKPIWPIPEYASIIMSFDWGHGAPFSLGWWWVDADGRLYRFAEWYGWDGKTPNVGCRLPDPEIAKGIKKREKKLGIDGRKIRRIAPPDCWSKAPNKSGEGRGPSTHQMFAEQGIFLTKGDPNRQLKIRQFHYRLLVPEDGALPMAVVYDNCTHFIRTIPALPHDESNIEDVDTESEDHVYDEAALAFMSRPISHLPKIKRSLTDKRLDELAKPTDYDAEVVRAMQLDAIEEYDWYQAEHGELEGTDYGDGTYPEDEY